jgi:hypothetical protein
MHRKAQNTKGGEKTAGKMDLSHIAGYLFVLSLIVSVIAGIAVGEYNIGANAQAWISVLFIVLGIVIGVCMSTSKKIEEEIYVLVLVMAGLLIASNMKVFESINTATSTNWGTSINAMVSYIATFSAAVIIVLAIRTLTRHHVSKISKS